MGLDKCLCYTLNIWMEEEQFCSVKADRRRLPLLEPLSEPKKFTQKTVQQELKANQVRTCCGKRGQLAGCLHSRCNYNLISLPSASPEIKQCLGTIQSEMRRGGSWPMGTRMILWWHWNVSRNLSWGDQNEKTKDHKWDGRDEKHFLWWWSQVVLSRSSRRLWTNNPSLLTTAICFSTSLY